MEFVLVTLLVFFIELIVIYGTNTSVAWKERTFWLLFSVQAFILFAFRDVDVLCDTVGYYHHFNNVSPTGLFEFNIDERFGKGFLLYEKFIHNYLTSDFLIYNIITTAITMIPVLRYFRNNSSCIWVSLLLFITLRLIYSESIAMRQGLALGICMLGNHYLSNEKQQLLKYLPYVLVAITFHSTAVFFFLIIIIYYYNRGNSKRLIVFFIGLFLLLFVGFESVLGKYYADSDGSRYLTSASNSGYFNLVGVYSSIILMIIWYYVNYMRKLCKIVEYDNLYIIVILSMLVSFLSIRLFVITRYLIYLYPFVIIYTTKMYSYGKIYKKGKNASRLLLMLMIANYIFIIYSRPEWVFDNTYKFWSNDINCYTNL